MANRFILWIILAAPGVAIMSRWMLTPDAYGYGHAIGESGDWAAWLLLVTLAVTPMRLLFLRTTVAKCLIKRRRDIGVASFGYAVAHTAIYLFNKAQPAIILAELIEWEYLTGWLAFALFVPLAITSNNLSMRRLKRSWKKLHRLVYPAAILTFVHWALTAFDPMTAYIHIGILAAIEIVRIVIQQYQRVT